MAIVNGKATLADVAKAAGVSPATAARVIHKNGYVSERNRIEVERAVETVGYRPNLVARSLRLKRSYTLGLVLSSARDNPFFTNVSHAIRMAAMERGYSVLTVNHGYSPKAEEAGVRQFLEHNVEAVILCHARWTANYAAIIDASVPIIQVERRGISAAHFVAIDPAPGIAGAVEALVEAGHRKIAFVGGATSMEEWNKESGAEPELARLDAFRSAVSEAGLPPEDCPTELGSYVRQAASDRLPGYAETLSLFRNDFAGVTALLAGSDVMAAGILQALYDLRLRVPDDISVIGYDDSLSQFLAPPLTAVAQPYAEIGVAVMELVACAGRANSGTGQTREVRTTLTLRGSVGRPRDRLFAHAPSLSR